MNSWLEFLEIWVRTSTHHSSHATHHAFHATLLRRLLRRSGLGGVLEERQQVRANSGVLDAIEGHFIVRHHAVRVGQPSIQRSIVPDNSRRFERLGVTLEARQRASLPSPKIGQTWPRHVAVGFERMAWRTGPEVLLTARGIAILGTRGGEECNCRKRDDAVPAHFQPPCFRSADILISAAAARIKTTMTSSQKIPM